MKFWICLICSFLCADDLKVDYQRMNKEKFHEVIVGNTILGITRQSKSLYMLHFRADGSCALWKKNQIYCGHWWMNQDQKEEDVVHAFWPGYVSSEPNSLFSPKNPSFGKPTTLRYYYNQTSNAFFVAGKAFQAPVLLAPGCAFPSDVERIAR